jgi:hypothetical protein
MPKLPALSRPEREIELAQSRTEEFLRGVAAGEHIAAADMFQDQGRPDFTHYPDRYRGVLKQACAIARNGARNNGELDRDGSWACYYGARAGMDKIVELNTEN